MKEITLPDLPLLEESINYISNLTKEQQQFYFSLYNKYVFLLKQYLISTTHLDEYDKVLTESKRNHHRVPDFNMDSYQLQYCDTLNFFYLRNDIRIESLSIEEQSFLNDLPFRTISDEAMSFVDKTYTKVLGITDSQENKLYGPNSSRFMAPADSIVIGIRFDDFYDTNDTEEWQQIHQKRELEANYYSKVIEDRINNQYNKKVKIIRYDDYSVKKKQQ